MTEECKTETTPEPVANRILAACRSAGVTEGRKFALTLGASIVSCVALFVGKATMDQWTMAQSLFLGMYGAANIIDKARGGKG